MMKRLRREIIWLRGWRESQSGNRVVCEETIEMQQIRTFFIQKCIFF